MDRDGANTLELVAWLENQPIDMEDDLNAVRRVVAQNERRGQLLAQAVARIELANAEGDPILSAWLSEAKAVLA